MTVFIALLKKALRLVDLDSQHRFFFDLEKDEKRGKQVRERREKENVLKNTYNNYYRRLIIFSSERKGGDSLVGNAIISVTKYVLKTCFVFVNVCVYSFSQLVTKKG